ncbi:MAG: hypothetical protein ACYDCL_09235 [Myxococcales bacterium]
MTSRFALSMRALAEALFCGPEGPPPAERLDWLSGEAMDVFRRADGGIRFVLRLAMLAVSLIAPLYLGRLTLMRRLPLELRIRALGRLERGWAAAPLLLLKVILCLMYYEHPDVEREVGVTGFGRVGLGALKTVA